MTPERWKQVAELFDAVAELPAAERATYLERACSDRELRREVDALLAASDGAPAAIDAVVGEVADALVTERASLAGRRFGAYRLVELIGRGGMGAVYRAVRDDDQYRTQVAIKILKHELEGDEAIARFRDERQILATLDHPAIVRLLDGGTQDGMPYLVMEHVDGVRIDRFCARADLSIGARVELVRKVCAAVHHAHQRLVIHRDIKPHNILCTADGNPKLLDFGIAKLLDERDREARTRTGGGLLTPEYASPEQLRGEQVSTATDIYSLGAVLFELLAGQSPHASARGPVELARVLAGREAPRASSVAPAARRRQLSGDLDNIVARCLEHDPTRRYASAEQLADDLQRYLDGHPVLAREATWLYRAGKLVRRHRVATAAVIGTVAALATATVVSIAQAREADAQARRADAEARLAQRRFTDVRRLATTLLFDVDAKIRDVEGTLGARQLIVTNALEYLDRLAAEATDDPALAREVAAAYARIGDIQGNYTMPNLRQPAAGITSYRKALAIFARLDVLGYDLDTRWGLASTTSGLGVMQIQTGALAEGIGALHAGAHLARPLTPRTPAEHIVAIGTYVHLHNAERQRGALPAARAAADGVVERADAWLKHGGGRDARFFAGMGHALRSEDDAIAGQLESSVPDHEAARAAYAELSAEAPENLTYRRELGYIHQRITALHCPGCRWAPAVDDLAKAEASAREAVAIGERLVERGPDDVRAAVELRAALSLLAGVLAARDPLAALPVFERVRSLDARVPPPLRNDAGCPIAELLARVGRRADLPAAPDLAAAPTLDARLEGAFCHDQLARARLVIGDRAAARAGAAATAQVLRALAASQPHDLRIRVGLADVLGLLAAVEPGQACAHHGEALAAWRAWTGPRGGYFTRRLAQLEATARACK